MNDDELDSVASSMLDAERARPEVVGSEVADRIFDKLTTSIGAGGGNGGGDDDGGGGAGAPKTALPSLASSKALAIAIAFAAGIGIGAIGHAKLFAPATVIITSPSPSPSAPIAAASSSAFTDSDAITPTASSSVDVAIVEPSPRPATTTTTTAARPPSDSALARERSSIEQARMALARGSATDALSALDTHAREFPSGRMAEERDALTIHALAMAGRNDEARTHAQAFRRAYPSSVFMPVVDRAAPRATP